MVHDGWSDLSSSEDSDDDWGERDEKTNTTKKITDRARKIRAHFRINQIPDGLEDAFAECERLREIEKDQERVKAMSRHAAARHRNRIQICIYFADYIATQKGREAELRGLLKKVGARNTAKGDPIEVMATRVMTKRRRRAIGLACALRNARLEKIEPEELLAYFKRSGGIQANEAKVQGQNFDPTPAEGDGEIGERYFEKTSDDLQIYGQARTLVTILVHGLLL